MSELNKPQLKTENNASFPNNNTNFITPELLRNFNSDMIDSLTLQSETNALSASIQGLIASGSGVQIENQGGALVTANTLNFVGSTVTASLSGNIATININGGG